MYLCLILAIMIFAGLVLGKWARFCRIPMVTGYIVAGTLIGPSLLGWITPGNIESFHFHGDADAYPITAVIAVPRDDKAAALLMGRFQSGDERHQILRPVSVIEELLGTILTVQNFIVAALALVGIATLASAALVFMLSLRIRRREIETMVKIGGSRAMIGSILATEMVSVFVMAALLAASLTWFTGQFAGSAFRVLIRS